MSTLAFNKEGEPFSFDNRTHQLRLRRFRKPGARGTCEAVLDADGEQVYIDVDADYAELRRAVDHVAGFYRLDQCDEDGRPIADLPAAYVSVEAVRNAGLSGDADAMTVVRELAAINAEVAKTMADRFAAVMQSTAEILRAADGAGIAHRKPVLEIANDEDDKDEGADDDDDVAPEPAPPTALESIATILQAVQPMLDTAMALYAQLKANAAQAGTPGAAHATPPAAATASESEPPSAPPSTASPSSGSVPDGAAAGSSEVASASAATTEKQTAKGASTAASGTPATQTTGAAAASSETARKSPTPAKPPASSVSAPVVETSAPTAESPATAVRNASLAPTMQQVAHLTAIRARLTPKEAAIAERVMKQMTPDMLGQWLVALSEQSVDEAVQTIRKTVASIEPAQRNTPGDGKRG